MIIRQARPGDAPQICAIANWVIRDTLITFAAQEKTEAQIRDAIAARGPAYLVAEDSGRIIGHATFSQFRAGPGYRHTAEHTIHLLPQAQGRRIGQALLAKLEQAAVEAGYHVLVAAVSGANAGGIAFHQKMGFTETGRLPDAGRKAGQWLDLVLMHKILTPGGMQETDSAEKPL